MHICDANMTATIRRMPTAAEIDAQGIDADLATSITYLSGLMGEGPAHCSVQYKGADKWVWIDGIRLPADWFTVAGEPDTIPCLDILGKDTRINREDYINRWAEHCQELYNLATEGDSLEIVEDIEMAVKTLAEKQFDRKVKAQR